MPSSADLSARMLAAYQGGDMATVLALGEHAADADDTMLLLLGAAQQSLARLDDALATFGRLVRRRPDVPEYWNNLAVVARGLGDGDTAEQALRRAVALAPHEAEIHYNLGLLYAEQQRWLLAREALLEAVHLAPGFIDARLQAAHACHVCGDNSAEEAMLDGAGHWPPQPAEQALKLATMLATQGALAAAFDVLDKAILPAGDDARIARLRIAARRAALHERNNRTAEAQGELAALPPSALDALAADQQGLRSEGWSAHAAVAARLGDLAGATMLYQRVLDHAGEADVRANAAFGLAAALDKQGRRDEAWQAALAAHAAQWEIARDIVPELLADGSQPLAMAGHRVGPAEHARWTSLSAPGGRESPVFVVGFPRSGTTLLEQMIDAHPDFRSMDERAFVYELTERMNLAGQAYPAGLTAMTQLEANQLRAIYAGLAARVVPDLGGRQLVDKNPLNMLCLPMIMRLFPEARIILCLRHPCDVLLSCFMQSFRSPAFMVMCSSLQRLAEGYVNAFEQWLGHVEVFAPRVLEWRYEAVVQGFDEHVAWLGRFLEVDDASPMARFAEHARNKGYISTPSYAQVTQGIHGKAVNRWHAYRDMFAPVLPTLRPLMQRLGYRE
ncbi:sulfotransferase [Dyella soli]|uniref:tetratricopeptide repeat-containing sulfotransferase family protein n=1 Tax=Dyella soli TaxID=522319 RepID=UPI001F0DF7A2|nr:sulfotransferase family protein [Dyella soli]